MNAACKINTDDCSAPSGKITKGLCRTHYKRQWKYGDPHVRHKVQRAPDRCQVNNTDCSPDKKIRRGLCTFHYVIQKKHDGDPLAASRTLRRHGLGHIPLNEVWKAMIQRCTNANHKDYPSYGGRGITVCDRWRGADGFLNFLADMGARPEGLSIDRRDNDGNYSCGKCAQCIANGWAMNCRWADALTQRMNQRRVLVTSRG